MTGDVEILHGLLAAALLTWAVYNLSSLRHPGPQRALWVAMVAIGVGETLHIEWLYRRADVATGPGWATVACHSAGLVGAIAVLDLLHSLLGHPRRARLANAAVGAGALAVAALPWIVDPPAAVPAVLVPYATYYDSTWRSALHWTAMLAYLAWALAAASAACVRYGREAGPGRLRTGMRLVSVGAAVGLLYVAGHAVVELAWWEHRGAPLARFDAAMDAITLGPAIAVITLGAVWQPLCAIGDAGIALYSGRVTRRRVVVLRPHWEWLVATMPDLSPFPEFVRAPTASPERLGWQQTRLVTEIYDAARRLAPYVSDVDREAVRAKLADRGLRGQDARAAADHVCTRLSVRRRAAAAATGTATREPHLPAANTAAAAARVAADLRRVQRRRVSRALAAVLQEQP